MADRLTTSQQRRIQNSHTEQQQLANTRSRRRFVEKGHMLPWERSTSQLWHSNRRGDILEDMSKYSNVYVSSGQPTPVNAVRAHSASRKKGQKPYEHIKEHNVSNISTKPLRSMSHTSHKNIGRQPIPVNHTHVQNSKNRQFQPHLTTEPIVSKHGPSVSKYGPSVSQHGPIVSQHNGPIVSKRGPILSTRGTYSSGQTGQLRHRHDKEQSVQFALPYSSSIKSYPIPHHTQSNTQDNVSNRINRHKAQHTIPISERVNSYIDKDATKVTHKPRTASNTRESNPSAPNDHFTNVASSGPSIPMTITSSADAVQFDIYIHHNGATSSFGPPSKHPTTVNPVSSTPCTSCVCENATESHQHATRSKNDSQRFPGDSLSTKGPIHVYDTSRQKQPNGLNQNAFHGSAEKLDNIPSKYKPIDAPNLKQIDASKHKQIDVSNRKDIDASKHNTRHVIIPVRPLTRKFNDEIPQSETPLGILYQNTHNEENIASQVKDKTHRCKRRTRRSNSSQFRRSNRIPTNVPARQDDFPTFGKNTMEKVVLEKPSRPVRSRSSSPAPIPQLAPSVDSGDGANHHLLRPDRRRTTYSVPTIPQENIRHREPVQENVSRITLQADPSTKKFLERQEAARELQKEKQKPHWATGENWTATLTKPQPFKLSVMHRPAPANTSETRNMPMKHVGQIRQTADRQISTRSSTTQASEDHRSDISSSKEDTRTKRSSSVTEDSRNAGNKVHTTSVNNMTANNSSSIHEANSDKSVSMNSPNQTFPEDVHHPENEYNSNDIIHSKLKENVSDIEVHNVENTSRPSFTGTQKLVSSASNKIQDCRPSSDQRTVSTKVTQPSVSTQDTCWPKSAMQEIPEEAAEYGDIRQSVSQSSNHDRDSFLDDIIAAIEQPTGIPTYALSLSPTSSDNTSKMSAHNLKHENNFSIELTTVEETEYESDDFKATDSPVPIEREKTIHESTRTSEVPVDSASVQHRIEQWETRKESRPIAVRRGLQVHARPPR